MHGCPQKFLQGGQSPILHSLYHPTLIPFASPPSFHSLPYLVFPPCTPPPRREAAPSNLAVVTGECCRLLIGIGGGAPTANVFRYILSPWNLPRGNDLGFSASQRVVIEATVVCTFSGFWQMSMSISPVEIIILTLQRTVMNVFCKTRLHLNVYVKKDCSWKWQSIKNVHRKDVKKSECMRVLHLSRGS